MNRIYVKTNRNLLACASLAVLASAGTNVRAADIETSMEDVTMRWDNTVKYSAAFRLKRQYQGLIADDPANNVNSLNLDDGDRNFNRGLVSNRIDLLSEFDFSYKKTYGARVSGAAWYDQVYHEHTDNTDPSRANQSSVPYNDFTAATRRLHGGMAELLDAFVYANDGDGNVRLGRHSLLYGETLFFGANGIANAQAPVDYVKLLSVPGSQFKEIILPVDQLSAQYKVADGLTAGGYYQFEWRKSRIPAAGSYFSSVDVFDAGGENFLFAPGFGVPRIADKRPSDLGQFGGQLRWRPSFVDAEFGFYAARYNDKLFQPILRALPVLTNGAVNGPMNYQLVYPEGIKTFGFSASTVVADINVASEFSIRRNAPLVGGATIDMNPLGSGNTTATAAYPVGNTAHANISAVAFFSGAYMPWSNASLLAEAGWNRVLKVTTNAAALDPTTTRDAWGLRLIFEPSWFQIAPGFDLSAPVGLGYNPHGKSGAVQLFNGGVNKGGDLSLGFKGVYQQVWKGSINYTHYMGAAGGALGADTFLTFKQSLADRDFISLSVQRTF